MVGHETPARTASVFWSMPASALAARICAAVITGQNSRLSLQDACIILS
jgi:hypothetical protein